MAINFVLVYKRIQTKTTYFLGRTRSTITDSAPAMMLSPASEDDMPALRFRSRSFDAKFSFVAITFGAMPNSPKSCEKIHSVSV